MISLDTVLKATSGRVISKGKIEFLGVSIDSRTIKDGEIFIALKGDRFDGHNFVLEALKKGDGAIVEEGFVFQDLELSNKTIISVKDTLYALQDLAKYLRRGFNGHVISVVGSNGKTTTKELLSSILATRLNVLKTKDNLNNQIGLPLCIVNGVSNPDIMVLEMGTNRPFDIDELCRIAYPDIGIITNIGYEHLEGFGSLENVRDAELEVLPYIKRAIVNGDDRFLLEGVRERFLGEIFTYGINRDDVDIRAKDIQVYEDGIRFVLCSKEGAVSIRSNLSGYFNVYNMIAAALAALSLGFDLEEIKKGLELFSGVKMRFEVRRYQGVTVLNDVYNANPSSIEESLNELMRLYQSSTHRGGNRHKRAIAVLGDMLELGDYSIKAHQELGKRIAKLPIDIFIGVGPLMDFAVRECSSKAIHAENNEIAGYKLKETIQEGDIVLIKGSRGMKMEKITNIIEDMFN